MATKKETQELVAIKPLEIKRVPIRIVGDSPLITHCWSEKAKKQMLDKQTKATVSKAKVARNPYEEFIDSMYWLTEKPKPNPDEFKKAVENGAKWGFPLTAVKQSANSSAYRLGWVKNQMELRSTYFLTSEYGDMFEIKGSIPEMREDNCTIGMGTADLRYRAEFKNWYADLILEFNASGNLTMEQVINCINAGGFCCGLGEWRVEKDGVYGRYHVETV